MLLILSLVLTEKSLETVYLSRNRQFIYIFMQQTLKCLNVSPCPVLGNGNTEIRDLHLIFINAQTLWRNGCAKNYNRGFPGGAVVESLPANAGDTGSSPGLGGSHMPRSN